MKKFLISIFIFFMSLTSTFAEVDDKILPSQLGLVQKVEYIDMDNEVAQVKQVVDIKLLKGDLKGSLIQVDNMLTGNPYYDIKLKKGMKVILHVEEGEDIPVFSIEDVQRSHSIVLLSLIFCGLLVYVGKRKGLNSLISIAVTCVLITNILAPLILAGINPVIATILICLVSTAITMYLVGGFNKKSTAATAGATMSLVVAGIMSFMTVKFASLTGFSNETSMFLYTAHPGLDFISITIATMILATLGAVMDVAMSIASTINEIYTVDSSKTIKELFTSGMNVGRDIIGTMANTLILVYLGASLPLLLLASNIDLQKFINLNQVVTEISSALIGSCAIVICVPITAFVASQLVKHSPHKSDFSTLEE